MSETRPPATLRAQSPEDWASMTGPEFHQFLATEADNRSQLANYATNHLVGTNGGPTREEIASYSNQTADLSSHAELVRDTAAPEDRARMDATEKALEEGWYQRASTIGGSSGVREDAIVTFHRTDRR